MRSPTEQSSLARRTLLLFGDKRSRRNLFPFSFFCLVQPMRNCIMEPPSVEPIAIYQMLQCAILFIIVRFELTFSRSASYAILLLLSEETGGLSGLYEAEKGEWDESETSRQQPKQAARREVFSEKKRTLASLRWRRARNIVCCAIL